MIGLSIAAKYTISSRMNFFKLKWGSLSSAILFLSLILLCR